MEKFKSLSKENTYEVEQKILYTQYYNALPFLSYP